VPVDEQEVQELQAGSVAAVARRTLRCRFRIEGRLSPGIITAYWRVLSKWVVIPETLTKRKDDILSM
jgi:hypothetical protein